MTGRVTSRITMDLMRDKITYTQAQRAFADPEAWTKSRRGLKNTHYRWWGKYQTARQVVAYCWYVNRNEAGYFVGWREVYAEDGSYKRDQFVARKTKWRLCQLQKQRTNALIAKGAKRFKKKRK